MKQFLPKSIQRLSEVLSTLPGIGPKTANRLTFYLLSRSETELSRFAEAFSNLKTNLVTCSICQVISEEDPCPICTDSSRDEKLIAVVEEALDVLALEKTKFKGKYHVLGGQISPLHNIGPSDLTIEILLKRVASGQINELILATDPSLEGEATALYIDEQIRNLQINSDSSNKVLVSRLAHGLPVGGDLEYADELTLSRALDGRRVYKQ